MRSEVYLEMATVQERHWWFAARRRILLSIIGKLGLPPQAEILEIGCGTGGNLAMLSNFGNVHAMEFDEQARTIADALHVCPVSPGGLPDQVPFSDRSFDLICLLDVLEHIEDDRASLERVGRLLKPFGRILVTVPAYAWMWSPHDEAHNHHRRYTAGMLKKQAHAAGLKVARVGYFNTLLFPLIATARVTGKLTGGDRGSDAAMPLWTVNTILTKIFGLERHVAPTYLFPFGTSVLAVLAAAT